MPYVGCILITLTVGFSSWAEPVASIEDLKGAELPHGIVQLPRRDSAEARRLGGCIFRFSDATFHEIPKAGAKDGKQNANGVFQSVHERKLGDLTYSPMNEGTFISWSGRISDLGEGFLYELDGKTLIQPPLVYSVQERSGSTGKGYGGFLEHLVEGHRYIVQTTDGKCALIRLLEKGKEGAVIQWILQPNGSRAFQIPKAEPEQYQVRLPGRQTSIRGDEDRSGLDKSYELRNEAKAHLAARKALIQRLILVVDAQGGEGRGDVALKIEAIKSLGAMRATEAVPVLIKHIDFVDRNAPMRELNTAALYPAVGALESIGKPGSRTAIEGIRDAYRFDVDGDENRRLSRIQLLTQVVVRVEGQDVARFILERELHNAGEASKPAFAQALEYLKLNPC